MNRRFLIQSLLLLILATGVAIPSPYSFAQGILQSEISFVYLTWQSEDVSTKITINYHSSENFKKSAVYYDTISRKGRVENYNSVSQGTNVKIEGVTRGIHRVQLSQLKPGKTYYFVVGDETTGYSKEYKFRTVPKNGKPIRFITGGDVGIRIITKNMMAMAAKTNPHFVAFGGDIAYANGKVKNMKMWDTWLGYWQDTMVSPSGHLIPLMVGIGNHEVNDTFQSKQKRAPFFYGLFAQGLTKKSYFTRVLNDSTVLYFLDTGHINPPFGKQASWLKKQFKKYPNHSQKIAIYHVPLFPSNRSYKSFPSDLMRKSWLKYFDRYNLRTAFENHDHMYKRTFPLRDKKIDKNGTVYLGDGCWGRSPRKSNDQWYLEKVEPKNHFWRVQIIKDKARYQALDEFGDVIDSFQR